MTIAAVLACEMIEDETRLALERAFPGGVWPPVVWVEAELHERPTKLKAALQEAVDRLDEGARYGRPVRLSSIKPGEGPASQRTAEVEVGPSGDIVLGFGYCGGGLKQLVSGERRLVFPRSDDCIELFLDGGCGRGQTQRDPHSYYLTKGWFCHGSAIRESYSDWEERYGPDRAKHIRDLMFANYERLSLIDTGAYEVAEWLPKSLERAEELGLQHQILPGSVDLLERLFAGDWGSPDVVVLEPGQAVSISCLFGAA